MKLVRGDCAEAMARMDAASVDAVVTDPPYGIGFMGKRWDEAGSFVERRPDTAVRFDRVAGNHHPVSAADAARTRRSENQKFQAWSEAWAREAFRVLKPGGYLLAFGGTRTYHRLAAGVEDAGFEVRDCVAWLYGSGFPKSHDVSKAIDAQAGAKREVVGEGSAFGRGSMRNRSRVETGYRPTEVNPDGGRATITAPSSDAAKAWQGWGTALKPAFEPIVVARKPLVGTVAANVLAHGTGTLNIDGCRIDTDGEVVTAGLSDPANREGVVGKAWQAKSDKDRNQQAQRESLERTNALGRWPANVVMDEEAGAMLDEQSGKSSSKVGKPRASAEPGNGWGMTATGSEYADTGGASRFFYCAKAGKEERNAGLDEFERSFAPTMGNGIGGKEHDPATATPKANVHPTVKPIALMRWLLRLVTPPGGLVLDPFVGSGSTGCAAALEGFDFVGVDRDDDGTYLPIAEARIAFWREHGEDGLRIVRERDAAEAAREAVAAAGQTDIFGLLEP